MLSCSKSLCYFIEVFVVWSLVSWILSLWPVYMGLGQASGGALSGQPSPPTAPAPLLLRGQSGFATGAASRVALSQTQHNQRRNFPNLCPKQQFNNIKATFGFCFSFQEKMFGEYNNLNRWRTCSALNLSISAFTRTWSFIFQVPIREQ